MTRADRVLAGAVGIIVVAAVTASVVASQRSVQTYDPASPAGVVQSYLGAVADGQDPTTTGLLAADSPCAGGDTAEFYLPSAFSAQLVAETVRADTATVAVEVEEGAGDPFGDGWRHEESFQLVLQDGQWRLSGTPWPIGFCDGLVTK